MAKQFSNEEKSQARRLRAEGKKLTEIAKIMARSLGGVWIHVTDAEKHPAVYRDWSPRPDRLQADEREQIAIGIGRGQSLSSIAGNIGRSPSTVTREVVVNGGRQHYRAFDAHNRARRCSKRPKGSKLDHVPWPPR